MGVFDRPPTPPKTFADALMGELAGSEFPVQGGENVLSTPEAPALTEKALVLDSFTQYVEEKLGEGETDRLSFPGGEILRRPDPLADFAPVHPSREAWESAQRERMGTDRWLTLREGKDERPLVLFVGDAFASASGGPAPEGVGGEFLACFPAQVAELFQKMVQAMRLAPGEFALSVLRDEGGEKTLQELLEEAWWLRPRFLVPLGAQACQALLGPRERLAAVHGKFFPLPGLPYGTQVAPLFHPGVIATNQNMKKSTWADMQKIMQALGKA